MRTDTFRFILEEGADESDLNALIQALSALPPDELEKAVAAHPSHLQQRDKQGQFLTFNPRREQPRGTHGRFVKRLTKEESQEATRQAEVIRGWFDRQMSNHYGDMRSGRLDAKEATKRGSEAISEYYEQIMRAGMQAAGNPGILLNARDKAILSRIVRDEQDYWKGFMHDIAAGKGAIDYDIRKEMYINASHEAYWLGWVIGDLRPKRRIQWGVGPTEHCETCLKMSKMGAMSVLVFLREALSKGYLPQSGYLACRGVKCQCFLFEVV